MRGQRIPAPEGVKLPDLEIKDRQYRLKLSNVPLSWIIMSKSNDRKALLYTDDNGLNHELRYARNQRSPFVEKQDGHALVEHVEFIDGFLSVGKENMTLQYFLYLHPGYGKLFEEIDPEQNASEELSYLDLEEQARDLARELVSDVDVAEALYIDLIGRNPDKLSSSEIKKAVRRYAANNPEEFMRAASKASKSTDNSIQSYIDDNLIQIRKDGTVWYNLPSNKKKMLTPEQGQDPIEAIETFFETDEGLQAVREIERIQQTK